jgi:hypothetical protein
MCRSMSSRNRQSLADRVTNAAESILAEQKHVSPLDVLLGIGWVDPNLLRRWQQGQVECLEETIQANPARIAEALSLLSAWAEQEGLVAEQTSYVARTPQRQPLRFSRSGDPALEQLYRRSGFPRRSRSGSARG